MNVGPEVPRCKSAEKWKGANRKDQYLVVGIRSIVDCTTFVKLESS